MKATITLTLIVISALLFSVAFVGTAMAATNQATDPGGGGILLQNSPNVTVTSTQLGLVKAVFDSAGNCLASSDGDPLCGAAPFDTTAVLTGSILTFVIYVDNTTAIQANNVRFSDSIVDVAPDYFQYQTQFTGCAATEGMIYNTAGTGATKAAIYGALTGGGGTCLSNALDGATAGEYGGIDTTGSPDVLTVGGTGANGSNAQLNVVATTTWAIAFDVIKLD